ncbi:uncharacterized protein LACBIDRAFT_256459 [Laccaria bicolor S238N-H82]|uniref:Predicted protein n=1 Tax=Laccaria bicolor (strain S238N-H82 / ATCC MYA-4686) TaxID=486041 RepID=B0E227_LACBS|nr:uncharacterized protein LACBIDRAFT_256459 [Laccaria bicolor S238N-H82]EDQ99122.1 predicted protein [Laccaria bicolor S238N-H82]|eukprot:XP_001890255.1 predicted protein [Laccaria bicolor S238N-H82]
MHPRNPYRNPPDFYQLAADYPPLLKQKLKGIIFLVSRLLNLKSCHSYRQLTQAILHRDFGLSISLPKHRLCPPVPNRLNYVLWIQDIMHAHRHLQSSPSHIIRGIDVGTGASAIYPLLACKLEPTWEFVATEIDETSHTYAKSNINLAGLEERVLIAKASLEKPLLFPMNDWQLKDFDFIMCNPPFYSSEEEVKESAGLKELRPNAVRCLF